MRRIRIVWTGKTKEGFLAEGIEKYLRVLRRFVKIEVTELKEERINEPERAKKREGEKILRNTKDFILLTERGRLMTSEEFSEYLFSYDEPVFVIGGPYGVSAEVESSARDRVSLSPMTLTHEMTRLVLLEQLYRAITIKKGMRYHH
ncbi:MAG: 23S rRNA (pseudouridine(1915)-N(3))-methyltransferase RlmH [Nitrospirae bacterium]|nr:MAG: 23S rRNA (pseudouridine(1915)-N(3))-methyltransferase RlmH [Nitrospirota bacterium]